MKLSRFALSIAALCSLFCGPADAFSPEGRLTLSSYKVRQGEVLVLGVRSPREVARLEGQFMDRLVSFFKTEDGDYEALIGIDMEAKPGFYEARVHLLSKTGDTAVLRKNLEVKEGNFSAEKLTVPDKMVAFDEETRARIQAESARMEEVLASQSPRAFGTSFGLPVQGQVTSSFGRRRVLNGIKKTSHGGTDIKAPTGAVVTAPAAGTVVLAEEHYLPGNAVVIDHGAGVFTGYFHLKEIRVEAGQTVAAGDVLGFVGMTGRVTGPHLHWMARVSGARVDPVSLKRLKISEASPEAPRDEPESPEPEATDLASRS